MPCGIQPAMSVRARPAETRMTIQVYRAIWRGGMCVAVKVVRNVAGGPCPSEFIREIEVLRACKSPYIVQFLGANMTPDTIVIVTEFMAGGSLRMLLRCKQVTWYMRYGASWVACCIHCLCAKYLIVMLMHLICMAELNKGAAENSPCLHP